MWAVGELTLHLGQMEIIIGSPSECVRRLCTCAITSINDYQHHFWTILIQKINDWSFNPIITKRPQIEEVIRNSQSQVQEAVKQLIQEDYTLFMMVVTLIFFLYFYLLYSSLVLAPSISPPQGKIVSSRFPLEFGGCPWVYNLRVEKIKGGQCPVRECLGVVCRNYGLCNFRVWVVNCERGVTKNVKEVYD